MADLIRQTLGAGEQLTADGGRFFKLVQSGAPVDITFEFGGSTKKATAVEAGYQFGPLPEDRRFSRVKIRSSSGQTIAAFVGDDLEDYERIVGVFQQQISSALAAPGVDVAVGAVATQLAAQNLSRRRITVKLLTGADTNVRVGPTGTIAANRGLQLEPGQSYTYEGSAAVHAIREGGSTASMCVLEEIY